MTTSDWWLLVAGVICIGGTIGLVAVEEALSTVSRAHVRDLADAGRRGASALVRMLDDRARYVNGLLFARITTATAATVCVTVLFWSLIASPLWLGPVVAGVVMLVIGYVGFGVAARTVGRQHGDSVAIAGLGAARICHLLFGWLAVLMIQLGNAVTPGRGYRQGPFVSQSELREIVDLAEADHVIEADERQMIHSVFELGGTHARNVMVPRTEMVWIEQDKNLRQAMSLALRSGFSRIPVIGSDLDDVVGVVLLRDLVRRAFDDRDGWESDRVSSVMRGVTFVPDSKPVDDLLRELQAARVHLALVADEYGGTAGLITIEDIVEEIVGEITDEHDRDEVADLVRLGPGRWRVSARLPLDDLAEATGMDVAEDLESVETVGGLLARRLGVVPIPGSRIEVDGWVLVAEESADRRHRIGTVLVGPASTGPASTGDKGRDSNA